MGNSCDNENIASQTNEADSDSNLEQSSVCGEQAKIDMLEMFDKASIGNEFADSGNAGRPRTSNPSKEADPKREQLARENWCRHKGDNEVDATTVSKRFAKVRDFEEKSLKWQAAIFWTLFAMLSLIAVAIGMANKIF